MVAQVVAGDVDAEVRREVGFDELPVTDLFVFRRWAWGNGRNPADDVGDKELREAYGEHLEMLKLAFEHPCYFAMAIGLEVFPQQWTTARAVLDNGKVAIRGCHSSGKTFMLAVVVVWWALRYEDSIVITTAPTARQVKDIMWPNIRVIHEMVREELRLKMPPPDLTQWNIAPKNSVRGVATDKTVNFQGYHSQNTLIVMDEAPGIAADLWGAIAGITSSGSVRIVMAGNPTIISGMFYDASTSREGWEAIRYSALEHNPNVEGLELGEWPEDVPRPKDMTALEVGRLARLVFCEEDDPLLDANVTPHMVTRRWIRERWFEWGAVDHPNWHGRVLGEFPPEDEHSLVSRAVLDDAREQPTITLEEAVRLEWGIDVAGQGDNETVLIAQQDLQILGTWVFKQLDPRPMIKAAIEPYLDQTRIIRIDNKAIGKDTWLDIGYWVSETPYPIQVIGVDGGKRAENVKDFENMRAEIFFRLRAVLNQRKVKGLQDEVLRGQLLSLRWFVKEQGSRIFMEPKREMEERGVPSPDRADALAYAMCGYYEDDVTENVVKQWTADEDFEIAPF